MLLLASPRRIHIPTQTRLASARYRHRRALPRALAAITPSETVPEIFSSDALVDRKSRFVGHAACVSDVGGVAAVVEQLLEDRKIARATHPTMYAYRITKQGDDGKRSFDCDSYDDGEAHAGTRIRDLLETLDVENTLVVVTRWYGGAHLGADRFRHITQAARDALQLGGLVPKK